MIKRHNSYS